MSRQKRIRKQRKVASLLLRQCIDKVRHRSEWKAIRTAKQMWMKSSDVVMEPYRCPHCGGWHIGHRGKS